MWAVFADPEQLAGMTPLVAEIHDEGERWRWRMVGITKLGITATPAFTTLMDIHDTGMRFRPDPANPEPASAEGEIRVEPRGPDTTDITLDLTATVELPLPKLARPAVQRVMDVTLAAGGRRFSRNFLAVLADPPSDGLKVRSAPVGGS